MNDTDLDQAIHEQLERLVADAPLPPSVDDITAPTVRLAAPSPRRPLLVGAAAGVVVLAVVGAVLLRAQGDDAAPLASEPAGPRAYGVPQDPPPGAGELPRLVVTLPGWVATPQEDEQPTVDQGEGEFRVVYYGTESAWRPLLEVVTTTTGYGLGNDGREVQIQGHAGTVADWGDGVAAAGWYDGDETVSIRGDGYTEAELLAMAESLVRDADQQYVLPSPPAGTVELFHTQDPTAGGPSSGAFFTAPDDTPADQGFGVELAMYSGGPDVLWERLSDKLLGAYENEELVTVRGNRALLAETDGDYRVIWAERDGNTAVEVTYGGDRETLDRILDSLVEVDEATWQALRADPAAVTPTSAPAATTTTP